MRLPDAKYRLYPRLDVEEFIDPSDVGPDELENTLTSLQARAVFRRLGGWEFSLMPALIRCVAREMIDDIDEAYLTGAVADPTCKARHIGCDNNQAVKGSDDFDIAILVDDWDLPLLSSALTQHLLPELLTPIQSATVLSIQTSAWFYKELRLSSERVAHPAIGRVKWLKPLII